jgi:hypothetical protein
VRRNIDDRSGPNGPKGRRAAGWLLWLVGGAALLLALSGSAETHPAFQTDSPPPALTQVRDTVFRHQDHERVDCLSCHTVDPVHGEVRVRTLSDCRSCHHQAPLATDCARCHAAGDVPAVTFSLPRVPELSVGAAPERPLPFQHADHAGVGCTSCHTEGLALSAARVDCATCHQEHHAPEARCATCHLPALATPPHSLEVHRGCGGTGCHTELPFEGVPRTRNFCVTCHQEMEEHRSGQPCTNCHLLPRPNQAPRPGPSGRAAAGAAERPRREGAE